MLAQPTQSENLSAVPVALGDRLDDFERRRIHDPGVIEIQVDLGRVFPGSKEARKPGSRREEETAVNGIDLARGRAGNRYLKLLGMIPCKDQSSDYDSPRRRQPQDW